MTDDGYSRIDGVFYRRDPVFDATGMASAKSIMDVVEATGVRRILNDSAPCDAALTGLLAPQSAAARRELIDAGVQIGVRGPMRLDLIDLGVDWFVQFAAGVEEVVRAAQHHLVAREQGCMLTVWPANQRYSHELATTFSGSGVTPDVSWMLDGLPQWHGFPSAVRNIHVRFGKQSHVDYMEYVRTLGIVRGRVPPIPVASAPSVLYACMRAFNDPKHWLSPEYDHGG